MKRLAKLAIIAAVTTMMTTPLVTWPVNINSATSVARAADTVALDWSVSTKAGDNEQIFLPPDAIPNIDPTILVNTLTYRQLLSEIGLSALVTPLKQLTIISEYKYNGLPKVAAIDAMNALVDPEIPIDSARFDDMVVELWGEYGKDGYTLTPTSLDQQLDQQISYETMADGTIKVEPLIVTFTKIPVTLTGTLAMTLATPDKTTPFAQKDFTLTDLALQTATIQTAYNLAYPTTNPIESIRAVSNYLNGVMTAEQAVATYNQATNTTHTVAAFLQLPQIAQDAYQLKGYEIDEAKLAQNLTTDISQSPVTDAKIADITLTIPLKKYVPQPTEPESPEKPEITIPPVTGQTGLPDYNGAVQKPINMYIYATRAINLYKTPTFTKSNQLTGYSKQRRVNRPVFKVIGYDYSNAGRLRYRVIDTNNGRKTGYITARASFTRPLYYTKLPKNRIITVINQKGIYGYRAKSLTGSRVHYKKGTHLKVKKVQKHNLTTRYQLTNGRYITTNNKFIIAGRY